MAILMIWFTTMISRNRISGPPRPMGALATIGDSNPFDLGDNFCLAPT